VQITSSQLCLPIRADFCDCTLVGNHGAESADPDPRWQALIDEASIQARQAVQRMVPCWMPFRRILFDLHFLPVVSVPNRRVEHVLVRFFFEISAIEIFV
jgi:hypothetical protein